MLGLADTEKLRKWGKRTSGLSLVGLACFAAHGVDLRRDLVLPHLAFEWHLGLHTHDRFRGL